MKTSTQELIEILKDGLGDKFDDAVHESTGPDAIDNFFVNKSAHAEKLIELAIEDEAELGRIMAHQILNYMHSTCKAHNLTTAELDLATAA